MRGLVTIMCLACAVPAWAQSPAAPSSDGAHTVVVDTLGGLVRPNGEASELQVHHPLDTSTPRPVVLFVHGWGPSRTGISR